MPLVAPLLLKSGTTTLDADNVPIFELAEDIPLYLPSSFSSSAWCLQHHEYASSGAADSGKQQRPGRNYIVGGTDRGTEDCASLHEL